MMKNKIKTLYTLRRVHELEVEKKQHFLAILRQDREILITQLAELAITEQREREHAARHPLHFLPTGNYFLDLQQKQQNMTRAVSNLDLKIDQALNDLSEVIFEQKRTEHVIQKIEVNQQQIFDKEEQKQMDELALSLFQWRQAESL